MEIHKELRRIPVIELNLPSLVLVGAPNVGKSSIVRAISSGTPEVNDYPFTTRGVTIGHIFDKRNDRFQVMDTPGLLDRPEEERNEMEKLTFASLLHLPTSVIYVIDPSGTAGIKSPLIAQLKIRKYLRERFPKRPWLDVISKGDLTLSEEAQSLFKEFAIQPFSPNNNIGEHNSDSEKGEKEHEENESVPSHQEEEEGNVGTAKKNTKALVISVETRQNLPFLKERVKLMLYHLKDILISIGSTTSSYVNPGTSQNSN
jgi:GTP1/Obg family GTP-binding protein